MTLQNQLKRKNKFVEQMKKLIPLIKANLKGLVRNWKNILILIVLPLILISTIFSAFNPNGLQKITVGYALADDQGLDKKQFENAVSSFAEVTEYKNIDTCIQSLKYYQEYVCVNIKGRNPYYLEVHYDNTREPVIWEVIQRLEYAIQNVQKTESKGIAQGFLEKFKNTLGKLGTYQQTLHSTQGQIDTYIVQIDSTSNSLQTAKNDLTNTLNGMDRDIADTKISVNEARASTQNYYSRSIQAVNMVDANLMYINPTSETISYLTTARSQVSQTRSEIENTRRDAIQKLDSIDQKLYTYQQESINGRSYIYQIDNNAYQLATIKNNLYTYKTKIGQTEQELSNIKQEFDGITTLNAELLVNPVVVTNIPVYVPEIDQKIIDKNTAGLTEEEATVKGVSLISLQTIFPTVLVLITLFVSLLIGSFVALNEINAPAHTRIRLIKNSFMYEFVASLISAFIMVVLPIVIVLFIGNIIFQLGVMTHIFAVLLIISLLAGIFILLGFFLAYLVRKESLTLMISTFILVFIIFLSGFLLPIERMNPLWSHIADASPGAVTSTAFKQIVFYNVDLQGIMPKIVLLSITLLTLLGLTILTRYLKEK